MCNITCGVIFTLKPLDEASTALLTVRRSTQLPTESTSIVSLTGASLSSKVTKSWKMIVVSDECGSKYIAAPS